MSRASRITMAENFGVQGRGRSTTKSARSETSSRIDFFVLANLAMERASADR